MDGVGKDLRPFWITRNASTRLPLLHGRHFGSRRRGLMPQMPLPTSLAFWRNRESVARHCVGLGTRGFAELAPALRGQRRERSAREYGATSDVLQLAAGLDQAEGGEPSGSGAECGLGGVAGVAQDSACLTWRAAALPDGVPDGVIEAFVPSRPMIVTRGASQERGAGC